MFHFKVVIFQEYINNSKSEVEAKYVFPLDGSAAVCGFEAFINNKHIIGKVLNIYFDCEKFLIR